MKKRGKTAIQNVINVMLVLYMFSFSLSLSAEDLAGCDWEPFDFVFGGNFWPILEW